MVSEANRIDRPERISIEVLDHLEDAGPLALPRLRLGVLAPELSNSKRVSDPILYRSRKGEQIPLGGTNPVERLLSLGHWPRHSTELSYF